MWEVDFDVLMQVLLLVIQRGNTSICRSISRDRLKVDLDWGGWAHHSRKIPITILLIIVHQKSGNLLAIQYTKCE